MECWGAQGGANPQGGSIGTPGKGGYTSGKISSSSNKALYIFVGSRGQSSTSVVNDAGGYNGGGGGGSNGAGKKTVQVVVPPTYVSSMVQHGKLFLL